MQKGVDQVSDSCDSYGLTISIKKTAVVYQPAPGKPYKEPTFTVKGQRLQMVDKSTYLGSTLSRVAHIDDEVNASIAKASAAFGRLRGTRLDTKLKAYKAVVLPTLLYACEMWIVYQRHAKRLNHKARAKASPTELSCSDLCCSICNRQFRARIGLTSHLRTHK